MSDKKSITERPERGGESSTRAGHFQYAGNPNPVEIPARAQRDHSEERQVFCARYQSCLDFASRQGWDDFTCRMCSLARFAAKPSATHYANDRPGRGD